MTCGLPFDIVDKDGKPILSWRVLLLPYIEEGPLANAFKLDERWDSEHNRALLYIPHGVAHGYRVLGSQPMGLVYYTTYVYNPADELRRDWNDAEIGFDWTTSNR